MENDDRTWLDLRLDADRSWTDGLPSETNEWPAPNFLALGSDTPETISIDASAIAATGEIDVDLGPFEQDEQHVGWMPAALDPLEHEHIFEPVDEPSLLVDPLDVPVQVLHHTEPATVLATMAATPRIDRVDRELVDPFDVVGLDDSNDMSSTRSASADAIPPEDDITGTGGATDTTSPPDLSTIETVVESERPRSGPRLGTPDGELSQPVEPFGPHDPVGDAIGGSPEPAAIDDFDRDDAEPPLESGPDEIGEE